MIFNKNHYFKYIEKTLCKINDLEFKYKNLSDESLKLKTLNFKNNIVSGIKLNDLIPEAYALVREASSRVLSLRHFDVQIMGGIALNDRCVIEMNTGEGKTLTSTLPIYLNALFGKGVHVITINEYLSKRDANDNKELFNFLGLSVGLNLSNMSFFEKKEAYLCDITYGTNNEYTFDYLKDNIVYNANKKVQRSFLNYALIDEIDSILIDEARTPLVLSGCVKNVDFKTCFKILKIIVKLLKKNKDFYIDFKYQQIYLTEKGFFYIENLLKEFNLIKEIYSLYTLKKIFYLKYIISLLKAYYLYKCNVDYVVKDNKILIIDKVTGRFVLDKQWSDGLHQSIEIKENVKIRNENVILNSITFQNYFLLYKKLSGMTGTALTENLEFKSIYNLNIIKIPTNKPIIRKDNLDLVYVTKNEKINAIVKQIKICLSKGQPILIGTSSIKSSFFLSKKLLKLNIKHKVLNANFYQYENDIISKAGKINSVTIATNMVGRGTNIILGGNFKNDDYWIFNNKRVLDLGGLYVIGSEKHESRRIDNQLRGRCGRQGEPGTSVFYVSLEDSLIKNFISKSIVDFLKKINIYGKPIRNSFIDKIILNIQIKIENINFDIRKNLLEYDFIINDQRIIFNKLRNYYLKSKNIKNLFYFILKDVFRYLFNQFNFKFEFCKKIYNKINFIFIKDFNFKLSLRYYINFKYFINKKNLIYNYFINKIILKYKIFNIDIKKFILNILDNLWRDHLINLDNLKQGIYLRSYANKDPKQEYKRDSFIFFIDFLKKFKYFVVSKLSKIK